MDSATLTNAPREVTAAGKTYLVSALTLKDWGALQAWLRDHAKDPVVAAMESLARARAAGVEVSDEDRKALFQQARLDAKPWPPRVGTSPWFDAVETTDGGPLRFLGVVLRKHQPSLTDAEIEAVNDGASPEESRVILYRAMGYVPAPAPKAPGAEAEAASPPPTPTTGESSPSS